MGMVECPTCGREDFKSPKGMKQHHARTHGESVSYSVYECDNCGSEVEKKDSAVTGNVFCDRECFFEFDSERKSGPEHRWYEGGPLEVECEWCGSVLERDRHEVEQRDAFFCDHACFAEWKASSENWAKENHPAWKGGGGVEYGADWEQIAESVRERDGHKCRACGMTQATHQNKFGKSLHVHHVVPVREFTDPEDAHSLGNLVTACIPCHRKFEGLPVFPKR